MQTQHTRREKSAAAMVLTAVILGGLLLTNSGCSVVKAANQPDKKNLSVLSRGTPRGHVIAELGPPSWSEDNDGTKTDIFAFVQGYSKGVKVGRAFFHGAADAFTLGLWEVVAMPVETIADGTDMKVQVTYDEHELVQGVTYLQGTAS